MLPQVPLAQLAVFEAAARHVSFTAAARELGVTQSAVSQRVRQLEERLGRRLFRRRPQGLEITDEGRALLPLVEEALSRLSAGLDELFGRPGPRRSESPLVLRATIGFARYWLLPRLPRFLAREPGLRLRLLSSLWPDPEPQPGVDLEILYRREAPSGPALELLRDDLFPVAAPALAARLNEPADLAQERLIHTFGFHEGWAQWLAALGLPATLSRRPPLEADTATVALALAEIGQGVALARSSYVAEQLATGRLVAPFTRSIASSEAFWLVWQGNRALAPAAEAFRLWIAEESRAGR